MGLLGWIVLGGIAGWLAFRLLGREGQGCLTNVAVGIAGAVVGGILFSAIGGVGVTGFNLWSLGVALVGSVIFLAFLSWIRGEKGGRGQRGA